MALTSYRDLHVGQKGMDLVEGIYRLAGRLPDREKCELVSQLQRVAVSIPANVAEGYGRSHRGDCAHHLSMFRGSLIELKTLLTRTVRLRLVDRDPVLQTWQLSPDIGKMLTKLIASLRRAETRNPKPARCG